MGFIDGEILKKAILGRWEAKEDQMFQDLRATLDGYEAGQFTKGFVNRWLKMIGYKLNWENYEITRV